MITFITQWPEMCHWCWTRILEHFSWDFDAGWQRFWRA